MAWCRRSRLLAPASVLLAIVATLLLLPAPAAAQVVTTPVRDLSDNGVLDNIYLGADLGCQVTRVQWAGPGVPRFHPQGAQPADCGTFLAINNTLYAPDFVRHAGGTRVGPFLASMQPFTPVWQSARTGTGLPGSPWEITTSVSAEFGRINVTQRDWYDGAADTYYTEITVRNLGPPMPFHLYRAGDCAPPPSMGYGARGLTTPDSVACVQNRLNPWQDNFTEWIPLTPANVYENDTLALWQQVASQTAFPNTCDCQRLADTGAGLSWSGTLPTGGLARVAHGTRFYVPPPPQPPPPPPPGTAVADFDWYQDDCTNTLAWFEDRSTPSAGGSIVRSDWDWGDGTTSSFGGNPSPVPHLYPAYGAYAVRHTITDSNLRSASVTKTVVLEPCLLAAFAWSPVPPCDHEQVTFTDNSYATNPRFLTQSEWDFGDGTPVQTVNPWNPTVTHVFTLPGTYTVTLTVYDNQSHTDSIAQDVDVVGCPPAVDFDWSPDPPCAHEPVTFNDLSVPVAPWTLDLSAWEWGDGSPTQTINPWAANAVHTFANPGAYDVNLTVYDSAGRSNRTTERVTVQNCPPTVVFAWGPLQEPCNRERVTFMDGSTPGPNSTLASSEWQWGDGSPPQTVNPWAMFVTHTYANPGTYVVNLTVWDNFGRSNVSQDSVTVRDCNPIVDFDWFPVDPCHREPVTFNDLTVGFAPFVNMTWDFGDGVVVGPVPWSASIVHTYLAPGTYTVTLVVEDFYGRTNSTSKDIAIRDCTPTADFTWSPDPPCDKEMVTFTDQSSGFSPFVQMNWTWGDGSGTGDVPYQGTATHAYGWNGTYLVTLNVTDSFGRWDLASAVVVVLDCRPSADFEWRPVPACMGKPTTFRDLSVAVAPWTLASSTWRFGDGSQHGPRAWEWEVQHTYASFTNYTVNLTVEDSAGRTRSVEKVVAVVPCPDVMFRCWAPDRPYRRVLFYDMTTNRIGRITNWTWQFGDNTEGYVQHPRHDYPMPGDYLVRLTVTNNWGGQGQYERWCQARDNLPPTIDPVPVHYVYEGHRLTFRVTGTDPDGDPLLFYWDAYGLRELGATFRDGRFEWTPPPGSAGHHGPILFRVTDGEFWNSTFTAIVVVPLPEGYDRPDGGAHPQDVDGDGAADNVDLCPNVPDPEQLDRDGDGTGDACDEPVRPADPELCDGAAGLARDPIVRTTRAAGVELLWRPATGCNVEGYLVWEGDGLRLLGFVSHDPVAVDFLFEETAPPPGNRTYRIQTVVIGEPHLYDEARTALAGRVEVACRTCAAAGTTDDGADDGAATTAGGAGAGGGAASIAAGLRWGLLGLGALALLGAVGVALLVVLGRRRRQARGSVK